LIGTCTYQMYVPFVHISTQLYCVVYKTQYLVYVIILELSNTYFNCTIQK